ncbi:VOC family protein [Amycolatopsis umgeniensis]|uniref:Catechol 2,3-dioxygenase-like lactoylglutathione lyase family enzyme n=1 Tax=Amycolatopsis umgeniensis TaxID=336628 RepID=A0A841B7N8_9PSEU|nr:VOC family protein [Amycolatopsis umgeniensis]MBB5854933.1 catechol 2,3-dioxygenase-like lactoylglutathione lyase family enzyme [Amycolatopsis umgeniensis]
MTLKRLEHIGVVVHDLEAAKAFFVALGLELEGEASLKGDTVDRLTGLKGVRTDIAVLRPLDGHGGVELIKYQAPSGREADSRAPMNTPGIRHFVFSVEDIDDVLERLRPHGAELVGEVVRYEDSYRLCYVRGPEGIVVELAEELVRREA